MYRYVHIHMFVCQYLENWCFPESIFFLSSQTRWESKVYKTMRRSAIWLCASFDTPLFCCICLYKAVDVLDEIDMKVLVCMLGVRSSELLVVFYIHIYTHKYISWTFICNRSSIYTTCLETWNRARLIVEKFLCATSRDFTLASWKRKEKKKKEKVTSERTRVH